MSEPEAPREDRPRPQYGEYAPEGWTFQPPAGEHASDPAPQMSTPSAPPPTPVSAASDRTGRPARPVDRLVTIALLVIAVFGAWSAVGTLQSLPTLLPSAIRQAAEMLGTAAPATDYAPGPEVPGLLLTGSIIQVVLWLLTAWWSVVRLRAGRIAFWVPLLGGALSLVALYGIMFLVIASDPAFFDTLTGVR